jgi:cell division protein FtsN
MKFQHAARQRGGFAMGLIVGLLVGLALALGVALYIAKVPVPLVDKVPHRSAEQDAAEVEKLKSWDPNAGLGGKPVGRPTGAPPATAAASSASAAPLTVPVAAASVPARAASRALAAASAAEAAPKSARDPAALLAGQPVPAAAGEVPNRPDPFYYFVQAGAYSSADDAEQQRAKLAMQGIMTKVTEREQSGRVVHRVRLGPFDSRGEAESQQERLKAAGAEAVLVRIERPRSGNPG